MRIRGGVKRSLEVVGFSGQETLPEFPVPPLTIFV